MAETYFGKGRFSKSIEVLTEAEQLYKELLPHFDPNSLNISELYGNLAQAHHALKNYQTALDYIRLDPRTSQPLEKLSYENIEVLKVLMNCLLSVGEYEEVAELLAKLKTRRRTLLMHLLTTLKLLM